MGVIDDLAKEWGNEKFAAPIPFCERMEEMYRETKGAVLEMGSGLTTLVLDRLANERPDFERHVIAVEESVEWFEKLQPYLTKRTTLVCPGGDDTAWGLLPVAVRVGLVVVDGPCGDRIKALSYSKPFWADDVVLLFDDAKRDLRRIEKWCRDECQSFTYDSTGRGIATVRWVR